jgi:5'-nucleotidase
VAAAREGALRGIPAIATSAHPTLDLGPVADLTTRIAMTLPRLRRSDRAPLLNLNVPPLWGGDLRATRLGERIYEEIVDFRLDPRGREYLWLGGPGVRHERDAGTDTDAYDDGAASLSPLLLDLTDTAAADFSASLVAAIRSSAP